MSTSEEAARKMAEDFELHLPEPARIALRACEAREAWLSYVQAMLEGGIAFRSNIGADRWFVLFQPKPMLVGETEHSYAPIGFAHEETIDKAVEAALIKGAPSVRVVEVGGPGLVVTDSIAHWRAEGHDLLVVQPDAFSNP